MAKPLLPQRSQLSNEGNKHQSRHYAHDCHRHRRSTRSTLGGCDLSRSGGNTGGSDTLIFKGKLEESWENHVAKVFHKEESSCSGPWGRGNEGQRDRNGDRKEVTRARSHGSESRFFCLLCATQSLATLHGDVTITR